MKASNFSAPDLRAKSAGLTETIASTLTIELAAMQESKYFCTPIEERFERITRVARRALRIPVAAVTLFNGDSQWFKSVCGWRMSQLPLKDALCQVTLTTGRLTTIGDTVADARTQANRFVLEAPNFRAYAGYPLLDENGVISGTFCVFDTKPRKFSADDLESITDLAAMAQREVIGERMRGAHEELVSKLGVARREAMLDSLTRLWNRRGAMVMLDAAIKESRATGASLAVALIDLDNFKRINDRLGHQVGDEVLRTCASRLIRSVRMSDVVGRIGGDEFLLILSDADKDMTRHILNRLRNRIAESSVMTRYGAVAATISVGFTQMEKAEDITPEALLERADRALLTAKSEGRDRVLETR